MATFWREDGTWGCDRHWISKFPAELKFCYYTDCAKMCSGRPSVDSPAAKASESRKKGAARKPNKAKVIEVLKMKGTKECFYPGCTKKNREGSKYCSDSCRIKNARLRYNQRIRNRNEQHSKSK